MSGPQRVVEHARSMLGVQWRHQGRKPWAVDCLGLVELCLLAADWPGAVQKSARYGREPWDDRLRKGLREHLGDPVTGEWLPGDVPLFRWGKSEPSHVGILADYAYGGLSIIHASNLARKVVETSLTGRMRDYVIEVYRPEWEG
jgi:cell wall-associated NlpC family hydrolase